MAITGEWEAALKPEFGKPYYAKLYKTVIHEYRTHVIYPPSNDVFNAFNFTPLEKVKVVILGQDPYHGEGQANGLCSHKHISTAETAPSPANKVVGSLLMMMAIITIIATKTTTIFNIPQTE